MLWWRLPRGLVESRAFAPPELAGRYSGLYSVVVVVDYEDTPVGAYREIFIAPGAYRFFDGRKYLSITKIYVSTMASVVNGRANWGIPKELADFAIDRGKPGHETYTAAIGGRSFFEMELKSYPPSLPASSRFMPPRMLHFAQLLDGRVFRFRLSLSGSMRFARVLRAKIDPALFPDLTEGRLLAGARMSPCTLGMPVAAVLPGP
jgi:hypothetical protein